MRFRLPFWLSLLVAAPAAAAVNWPQPGLNAQHTGYNKKETTISAANLDSLTEKWATPIPYGIEGAAPIELNGVAYALATDGTVYAANATTGAVLWTYITGGAPTARGITSGGTLIYTTCKVDGIGQGHYGICALRAATGSVVWKYAITDVGGQMPSDSYPDQVPVVDHGKVFFSEAFGGFNSPVSGDYVTALNAATGAVAWQISESVTDKSGGTPFAVDNGRVFYPTGGAGTSICAANEADGSGGQCSPDLGGGGFAGYSALSAGGGKVFSQNNGVGNNTLFTAFEESTLAVAWNTPVAGTSGDGTLQPPAVANGLVYFNAGGNGHGSLYALSLKTGRQRWSYACGGAAGCLNSGVSVANGVLFASCITSNLGDQCTFDAKTGAVLRVYGSTDNNAGTYSTPLVANGAEIGACGAYGGNLCKFVP